MYSLDPVVSMWRHYGRGIFPVEWKEEKFQALRAKFKLQGHLQRAKNTPSCPAKSRGVVFFCCCCFSKHNGICTWVWRWRFLVTIGGEVTLKEVLGQVGSSACCTPSFRKGLIWNGWVDIKRGVVFSFVLFSNPCALFLLWLWHWYLWRPGLLRGVVSTPDVLRNF